MDKPVGLVALDGSADAECVLPWAGAIARALDLRLVLLSLVEGAWSDGNERNGASLRPARCYLTGVAQELVETGLEVTTRAGAAGDGVGESIIRVADELDAALVMLATHGRSGMRRTLLGSVADAVVRGSRRPVLVVRATPGPHPRVEPAIRHVLVPLDGSAVAEDALPAGAQIAQATGATLDLVQVVPWSWSLLASTPGIYLPEGLDEQMVKAARSYLRDVQEPLPRTLKCRPHVLRGDAARCLTAYAAEAGVDLVVMTTHARAGLARWTLGSVADKLVRSGKQAVLLERVRTEEP